jgi:MFS family permease
MTADYFAPSDTLIAADLAIADFAKQPTPISPVSAGRSPYWALAVLPILCVAMIAAAILGFTLPLVAFVFDRWGYDADLVGLNAAAGTCGILLLGAFLPRIIARIGLARIVAAAILTVMLALGAMAVFPNVVAWFLFKALLGLSLSVIWAGAELWINLAVDDAHRGRAFSVFTLLFWLGFGCGPSIIGLVGVEGALPLLFGAAVMALALPFLYAMPRDTGTIANDGKRHTMRLPVWPALIVLATAAMAGMGDGSLAALLPTFGLDYGFSEPQALALLTAFVAGGVTFQWPIGWLADKVDERALALGCIAGAGALLALLPIVIDETVFRLSLCFTAGGLVMSISTLGLTMVGRTFPGRALAVMSTWVSIFYEVGCTIGPVVAGAAMVAWGPHGLPLTLVLACFLVCVLFFVSAMRTRALDAHHRRHEAIEAAS